MISDVVNTASRLEGLTKLHALPILFSEETYNFLSDPSQYEIEQIGEVEIRGKAKTTKTYALLAKK